MNECPRIMITPYSRGIDITNKFLLQLCFSNKHLTYFVYFDFLKVLKIAYLIVYNAQLKKKTFWAKTLGTCFT